MAVKATMDPNSEIPPGNFEEFVKWFCKHWSHFPEAGRPVMSRIAMAEAWGMTEDQIKWALWNVSQPPLARETDTCGKLVAAVDSSLEAARHHRKPKP